MSNPTHALQPADIEAMERATLAAMPPEASEETSGWLLALDRGTVGRAHSAVPLQHEAPALDALDGIRARYAAHKLPLVLRLPRKPAFDTLQPKLQSWGLAASKPTCVQVADVRDVGELGTAAAVVIDDAVKADWAALFLGEGFDPVDGESRLGILRRARASIFASIVSEGQVVACGSACFSHGWAGVHGMRTVPAFRGRGLAGSILARFAREASARGIGRIFLQVEEGNRAARSLYARAGFADAWTYDYWK